MWFVLDHVALRAPQAVAVQRVAHLGARLAALGATALALNLLVMLIPEMSLPMAVALSPEQHQRRQHLHILTLPTILTVVVLALLHPQSTILMLLNPAMQRQAVAIQMLVMEVMGQSLHLQFLLQVTMIHTLLKAMLLRPQRCHNRSIVSSLINSSQ